MLFQLANVDSVAACGAWCCAVVHAVILDVVPAVVYYIVVVNLASLGGPQIRPGLDTSCLKVVILLTVGIVAPTG